jgi:type II secretory pathway component PulK
MRRGAVIVIALWATSIAAITASAIMLYAFRQASYGRESVARVKARWAARAGLENMIAIMSRDNLHPLKDDAFSMIREMESLSSGELLGASYDIQHHRDGINWRGPMDEHSKLNINDPQNFGYFYLLDNVTPDVADAIVDWTDADDELSTFGVERDYYLGLPTPYEPRNGPLRSSIELELIAGMWPEFVRGEDWNMNGRLDPNENDGNVSAPDDNADGVMKVTWGQLLTTYSRRGGMSDSGEERLNLRFASTEELVERLGIEEAQADALRSFASNPSVTLEMLLTTSLSSTVIPTATDVPPTRGGRQPQQAPQAGELDLDTDQLRLVLGECTTDDPLDGPQPGKLNINTVSEALLRQMFSDPTTERLVDEILYLRNNRGEGVTSLVDLKDIPDIEGPDLDRLARAFDVRSNVFLVSSKGRSSSSGLEVEIVAVVDRSTLPVKILEYREQ